MAKSMSECNRCTVPAAHARQERANRRLWIVCIILIIALVATNVAWIMYETQYKPEVREIYARHDGEKDIQIIAVRLIAGGFSFCYNYIRKRREDNIMPYNPTPYGAPYSNPYVDRYNAITAQNFAGAAQSYGGQITRVKGRNGAEAFRMTHNASVLLMDEDDPIVWLKASDGAGYCTLTSR